MPRKNLISLHEAVALALLEQPTRTANFKQIAEFIVERGLCPIRKGGITLEKQIMLRATKSKKVHAHLFEKIGAGYIRLRDSHADFPLQLYNGLETLLEFDNRFYNPVPKELSVVDKRYNLKQTRKIKLRPSEVVCIVSEEKSRRKNIYFVESATKEITQVELNNNKFNFESLCAHLDPLNHYLTVVSKNALVNVGFFELAEKNSLKFVASIKPGIDIPSIKLSSKTSSEKFSKNFRTIKEAYVRRILLQKTILGYKTDMGF